MNNVKYQKLNIILRSNTKWCVEHEDHQRHTHTHTHTQMINSITIYKRWVVLTPGLLHRRPMPPKPPPPLRFFHCTRITFAHNNKINYVACANCQDTTLA